MCDQRRRQPVGGPAALAGAPRHDDPGELEILSLAGTLSPDGVHLHMAVADSSGTVIGGHLCAGSLVRTTAELVLGLLPEWQFQPGAGSIHRLR